MLESIARSLEYDRNETIEIARAIPDDTCDALPAGLKQSPCWILCHLRLADARQHASLTANKLADADADMHDFGPGSDPAQAKQRMTARFGSWPNAIDAADASHQQLTAAIRNADPEHVTAPHPNESARTYFPTLLDNLIYAVWHEGNHGGQLRAWLHTARHAGLIGPA